MNNLPRIKLCEIISDYGKKLHQDPKRCKALLLDYCGEYKGEINVLVNALNEGIVTDLLQNSKNVPVKVTLARLKDHLQHDLHITEKSAIWAVESWALALGVISESDLQQWRSLDTIQTTSEQTANSNTLVSIPSNNKFSSKLSRDKNENEIQEHSINLTKFSKHIFQEWSTSTKLFIGAGTTIALFILTILVLGIRLISQMNTYSSKLEERIELLERLAILENKIGENIVDLLEQKKITIEAKGTGITLVGVEICQKKEVDNKLNVLIPAGTLFSQYETELIKPIKEVSPLISTKVETIFLRKGQCSSLRIPSVSIYSNRQFPQVEDTLILKQGFKEKEIKKLINLLAKNPVQLSNFESILIQQASMWILTNNLDYEQLGSLNLFPTFSRNLNFDRKISSNQTINGLLDKQDEENPKRTKRFKDDYLLSWIPPNYSVKVELLSSKFDPYLQVINASTGDIVASNDDGGEGNNSQLNFTTEFGVNYLIRVTTYSEKALGVYTVKTQTNGKQEKRLLNQEEIAQAMKLIDEADINIKSYAIWQNNSYIETDLDNQYLKEWLQDKREKNVNSEF